MKTDNYLLLITEQLRTAQNNEQVEIIISHSVEDIEKNGGTHLIKPFLTRLQAWLEKLSPLDYDSTQWSCFRYAAIYLRDFMVTDLV